MTGTTPPADPERLARVWRGWSSKVYGDYSPLNAALAAAAPSDREVMGLLLEAPERSHIPNMLLAAIQYVVLGGCDHPLAALYEEGAPLPGPDQVSALLGDFCRSFRPALAGLLGERVVQTNEVGRCAGLALAVARAARSLGSPVALVDAGASAGLNLLLDRYDLRLHQPGRTTAMGNASSAVRVDCELRSRQAAQPSSYVLPGIAARLGIDHDPVDITDADRRRWLLACVWPGTGRQERLRAAMDLALQDPPRLVRADMVEGLGAAVDQLPDIPTVVMTSWSFSYLSERDRARFEDAVSELGGRRRLAWVCNDAPGVSDLFPPPLMPDGPANRSVISIAEPGPGGWHAETLALTHSHGNWVEWLAAG